MVNDALVAAVTLMIIEHCFCCWTSEWKRKRMGNDYYYKYKRNMQIKLETKGMDMCDLMGATVCLSQINKIIAAQSTFTFFRFGLVWLYFWLPLDDNYSRSDINENRFKRVCRLCVLINHRYLGINLLLLLQHIHWIMKFAFHSLQLHGK